MVLIPQPKSVERRGGFLNTTGLACMSEIEDARIQSALNKLPLASDGAAFILHITGENGEGYAMDITEESVTVTAKSSQQEEYREELLLSIEGIAIMAELFSKFGGYPIARKTDTVSWLKRYREKWVSKNKESELAEIEKMFLYLDRL